MRSDRAVDKVLALLGLPGECPALVQVHFRALLPNNQGVGVYCFVQMDSVWAAAHFTSKGKLVKYERCAFDPEEVSIPLSPIWEIHQW